MNFLKLTKDKLDVNVLSDLVADESCGAISLFVGTTRDNFEDKKVVNLEYEAYDSMAVKVMTKICDDTRVKWPDIKHIAIYHRLGVVPVKEASVVIAISSPHRVASLEAVQFAIDELKKSVPIWKKEQYDDDSKAKRAKISRLDFSACSVETDTIPKSLVQIPADESEISRRIHCFLEKKREEIDLNNILDFTDTRLLDSADKSTDGSCARVSAVVHKQKDSKGHLKVHRVKNEIGPQTRPDYFNALDKLLVNSSQQLSQSDIKKEPMELSESKHEFELPFGLRERLENAEKFLCLKVPNTRHIYERIKAIENKILYLESISPEYRHFLSDKSPVNPRQDARQKKSYSVDEIDGIINTLKTGAG